MKSDSVDETVEEFEEYVEQAGDEVFDRFSDEFDDIGYLSGLACNRGENSYLVIAGEEFNYVNIEFQYSVINDFVNSDDGNELVVSVGEDDPEEVEDRREEMIEFLEGIDRETKERFYVEVLNRLQNESLAWAIRTEGPHDIIGFRLISRVFPFDDEVTLKDFDTSVQSVLSTGIPVRAYIQYTYSLQSGTIDSESDAEGSTNRFRFDF